ncbi:MAG: hypothetical protein LBR26_15430 [Prevotella sp.]|jgi:hypothetical protein|nr:hypothetical protein [Prevotella sp.]
MKLVLLYGLITAVFLCFGSCRQTDEKEGIELRRNYNRTLKNSLWIGDFAVIPERNECDIDAQGKINIDGVNIFGCFRAKKKSNDMVCRG